MGTGPFSSHGVTLLHPNPDDQGLDRFVEFQSANLHKRRPRVGAAEEACKATT